MNSTWHFIILKNGILKLYSSNIALLDIYDSQDTEHPVLALASILWKIVPKECTVRYYPLREGNTEIKLFQYYPTLENNTESNNDDS